MLTIDFACQRCVNVASSFVRNVPLLGEVYNRKVTVRAGDMWKSPYLPFNFAMKLKLL